MGERRVVEIPYSEFINILRHAIRTNTKIEPGDKEAWDAYVRKHDIPEAGFRVRVDGATVGGGTVAVIIEGTEEYDGYYRYSADEQICMRFESGLD